MQWAKVTAVLSGVILLLSTGAAMNTFAAKLQPISLSFELEGCKNDLSCGAEFLLGDTVTFTGTLTDMDGRPVPGAEVNIIKFLPKPAQVVVASGVTGIDGAYTLTWTAEFTPVEKAFQDVTTQILEENVVFYAQFNGDDKYSAARTAKATATISANTISTSVNSEKRVYSAGESALIFIAFVDSNDEFVDPTSIRVLIDDQEVQAENKKTGSYTVTTPPLTVEHHQVIVIPQNEGYNLKTGFLTVQVSGFFGKV
jgi:hypothetical protein